MQAKKNSLSANKKSATVLPEVPPVTEVDEGPKKISLENFKRESENVYINEEESIEALKRMGYTVADLNYKPLHRFRRPGCDETVTKLLFDKYQQKRENIINKALEIREQVIEEKKQKPPETAIIRRTKRFLEIEKKQATQIENDQNNMLRKLVLMQLRNLYLTQQHQSAVERTNSRIQQITEEKEIQIRAIRARTVPPGKGPQFFEVPEKTTLPLIDPIQERINTWRKQEEQKRMEKAKQMDDHNKSVVLRSEQLLQQQTEQKEKKISMEKEKYAKWETERQEALAVLNAKYKNRALKAQSVIQTRKNNEEERKQQILQKINEREAKSRSCCDMIHAQTQRRVEELRQKLDSRIQHVRETREKREREDQERRESFVKQDQDFKQKMHKMNQDQLIALLTKQADREERTEKAIRSAEGKRYQKERQLKIDAGDPQELQRLSQEKQTVEKEIQRSTTRYSIIKNQLISELNRMKGPEDKKALAKIQTLLCLSEDEMKKLIEAAKPTTPVPSSLRKPQQQNSSSDLSMNSNRSMRSASVPGQQQQQTSFRPTTAKQDNITRPSTTVNKTRSK